MKNLFSLLICGLLIAFLPKTINSQTITDILQCDTCDYYEKLQFIEDNNRRIYDNSELYEQKRYNRYRSFYDGRVDSKGSLETYPMAMIDYYFNMSTQTNSLPFTFYNEPMINHYFGSPAQGNHGQVHSVKSNPQNINTLYAGSAWGGLFRTYNAMATDPHDVVWQNISENYFSTGVLDIEIDPTDSNIIYVCSGIHLTALAYDGDYGEGIYKSTDGGNTWTHPLNLTSSQQIYIYSMAMDPTDPETMYAVSGNPYSGNIIYKTTDGWQNITTIDNTILNLGSGEGLLELIINPSNTDELYAFGNSAVLHSTNGGSSWTNITTNILSGTGYNVSRRFTMAWNQSENTPYCLYYHVVNGPPGNPGTIRKLDSGTWVTVKTPFGDIPGYCMEIQISPNGYIYAGGRYSYIKDGITYPRLNTSTSNSEIHDDLRDVTFSGSTCFMGTDGGVVRGTIGNVNGYVCINGNLNIAHIYGISFDSQDPQILFAGSHDNGTKVRDNQGNWTHKLGGDGGKTIIDWNNSTYMYGLDNSSFKKIENGSGVLFTGVGGLTYDSPIMQHTFNSNIVFAGSSNKAYVHFPPNTSVWYGYGPAAGRVTAMAMSESDSLTQCIAYSSGGSLLYISQTGHNGFTNVTSNIDANVTPYAKLMDIEIHPTDPDKIWIVFGNFVDGRKVYYTTNGGTSWTNITYNIPNIPCNAIVYDEVNGGCFLGTDGGLYYLADSDNEWQQMNLVDNTFPSAIVNELSISRTTGELIVATIGRGAWRGDIYCPNNAGSPLTISSTTTWPIGRKLTSSLIVDGNSTLTVQQTLKVPDAASITVKNGSTLIMDENSVLKGACKEYYEGTITVEPGGHLYLYGNSTIKMGGNGTINIQYSAGTAGTMDYYPDANIILNDAATVLNITGTLNIQTDATFTFTGSGYVKLSSTLSPSNNITAGTGTSFILNGTGKTDKILEVDQEGLNVPSNIVAFTLNNGWVNMKNSTARVDVSGSNTAISVDSIRFNPLDGTTRTNERGLWVYGQSSCVITNSDFEYGQYGIHGSLTSGASLVGSNKIENCTFTNNNYGLWIHDNSVDATNCNFSYNTYGFYGEYTSDDDNQIVDCSFQHDANPVYYVYCDGNLFVDGSIINYASQSGIYATGNHYLSLRCTHISNVTGLFKAGIYMSNGVFLNMTSSTSPATTFNSVTGPYAVKMSLAGSLYLNSGNNFICPNTVGTYKHLYGTITTGACPDNSMQATQNQWYANLDLLNASHYSVWKNTCSANTIISYPTAEHAECEGGGGEDFLIQEGELSSNTISDANFLAGNAALNNASETGDWLTPFNSYAEVLNGKIPDNNTVNEAIWENSWESMRHCLKEMYTTKQLNGTSNSNFAQTIAANNKMGQLQANNYYRKFQIDLEKATLYRMAGDYATAISLLTPLTEDTSAINREQAEAWLCIVTLEKQIAEGTISKSEIEEARAACPTYTEEVNEESFRKVNNQLPSTEQAALMNVIPNPVNETSILIVNTANDQDGIVEFTDLFGRIVSNVKVAAGYSENQLPTGLSKGTYTLLLKQGGITKTSLQIVVMK